VTWSDGAGLWGSDATGGIFGQMYDAAGAPVGSEFHVNTTTNEEQEQSQMLALADGGFMVFWLHDDNPQDLRFQRYDADGTTVGTEGVLATDVAVRHYQADAGDWKVITLEGGGLAALWRTSLASDEFHVQSFDLDGTAITDVVTIDSQQGGFDNSTHYTADIDQLPDGQLIVTWEYENTAGFGEIYTQTIDAPPALADLDGPQQLVPTTLVASDPALSVTADGGRVLFFAQADAGDNYGIWAQRYDANGVETGAIYQINTVETGRQVKPEVTVLKDGRILLSWMSGGTVDGTGEVRGRILDANGNLMSGNDDFLITPADTTANYARDQEVTALEDGGFVAVWYEYHDDSSLRGIYGQHFDATGTAVGDDFRIRDPQYYGENEAEVLALKDADGDGKAGFVVTWSANSGLWGSDATGGIFGQIYKPDPVTGDMEAVGSEFHVNTTTNEEQEQSQMLALADGGFMVFWLHDDNPQD
ncbi:hypothetical protein SM764_22525, partial [Pseudophaeobacter sp. 1A16562]|uniref:hypothetical protein n=1 Tax=Pseudophaeobacter sp. 1A16562 TaxID=3098143 RepID=UPI0034D5FA31